MAEPTPVEEASPSRGERFFTNVLWNWMGVGITLFTGVILSRYIIRKLGPEGYGVWSLTYSIIGYYGLFDLGFRSAVVRYSAHFLATREYGKLNELINTTFVYFSIVSAALLSGSFILSRYVDRFFQVSSALRQDFSALVLVVGIAIALGINLNVFTGCVEGFQRFDISSRVRIIGLGLRSVGCMALLALGYGLVAMGLWALSIQILMYSMYFFWVWRIFPALRFSTRFVKLPMLKQTANYGIHTFLAGASEQSLEQTPSLLIGHFLPAAFVGYFNLPLRLLQYAADAMTRVGIVAQPQATEFAAQGRLDVVAKLGIYSNRYCLMLYTPLTIVLLIYGRELIQLWVGAEYVRYSAPLLPILLVGTVFTTAGQFSSSTILFGLAKHQKLAYALFAEAVLSVVVMIYVIPRFGILGAALVGSGFMVLIRGFFTSWLMCREVHFPMFVYMYSIFAAPVLTGLPVLGLLFWLKKSFIPGGTWLQLFVASSLAAGLYLAAAAVTCLEPEHRETLVRLFRRQTIRLFGARAN